MDLNKRKEELTQLKLYTETIDKELTMILQSLQWDRNNLIEGPVTVPCKFDRNHKVPPDKRDEHEKGCFLRHNGYVQGDQLLPDPLDSRANTLVKLSTDEITQIIENAAKSDPLFKKGVECLGSQPLSLGSLQTTYTSDERRAIHDAVVTAVPSCHDLTDLSLLSSNNDAQKDTKEKSRQEILAELRNMRRRRTKYRVAAKTRNYSDVLRDVIKTQMEFYNEAQTEAVSKAAPNENKTNSAPHNSKNNDDTECYHNTRSTDTYNTGVIHKQTHKRESNEYKDKRHVGDKYKHERKSSRDEFYDRRHREESSGSHRERVDRDYRKSRERIRKQDDNEFSKRDKYDKEKLRNSKRHRDDERPYKGIPHDRRDDKLHREEKYKRYYEANKDDYYSDKRRLKK